MAEQYTQAAEQFDDFGEDAPNLVKPRILLMGLRKGGKSSILKVVFYKMSPHETLFLESTSTVEKSEIANSSFIQFQIWDFPGQIDFFSDDVNSQAIFTACDALVFVIDAQDDLGEALAKLQSTMIKAHQVNPKIKFEVFLHKVDGLTDEVKLETQREVQTHIVEELREHNVEDLAVTLHVTSIYDHTVFEAFSKVVQKLIPHLPSLEFLHDSLNSSCHIEKSFLFDVVSKIYISTDATPVDMATYELCSDMIDVVIDVSCIYGMREDGLGLAYDGRSAAVIRLNTGVILYLRHINRFLAIICVMKEEAMTRQGLIDHNIATFKEAVGKVFRGPITQN
eukprot:c4822_g1_i1.p1 GENE.c4822_g1_i1~~c4822_g1_i1.p1  ORF type:complete len:357 (-),score=78.28 c4822_g1_i1:108-1121(-)